MTHSLPSVQCRCHCPITRRFDHIVIPFDPEMVTAPLRAHKCQKNDIRVNTSQEDTDDLAVVVAFHLFERRKREAFANGRLNRARSR